MGINISAKTDYSQLLSSLNSRSSGGNLLNTINLSDYKSIKSGTYHKLLNSYYTEKKSENTNANKTQVDDKNTVSKTDSKKTTASEKTSDKITTENWKEKLNDTASTRKAATTYTASGTKTTAAVATSGFNISDYI